MEIQSKNQTFADAYANDTIFTGKGSRPFLENRDLGITSGTKFPLDAIAAELGICYASTTSRPRAKNPTPSPSAPLIFGLQISPPEAPTIGASGPIGK